jgi:hypothetical protein
MGFGLGNGMRFLVSQVGVCEQPSPGKLQGMTRRGHAHRKWIVRKILDRSGMRELRAYSLVANQSPLADQPDLNFVKRHPLEWGMLPEQ